MQDKPVSMIRGSGFRQLLEGPCRSRMEALVPLGYMSFFDSSRIRCAGVLPARCVRSA
jgi:hypothetical protein